MPNPLCFQVLEPRLLGQGDVVRFASSPQPDGSYEHIWYNETIGPEEATFEAGVFLLTKARARAEKARAEAPPQTTVVPVVTPPEQPLRQPEQEPVVLLGGEVEPGPTPQTRTLRLVGTVPAEMWNRLGTKIIPKLRAGISLEVEVGFTVVVHAESERTLRAELGRY